MDKPKSMHLGVDIKPYKQVAGKPSTEFIYSAGVVIYDS